MSNLSVFNFQGSHSIRVEIRNGEPLFCLSDVLPILGLQNRSISKFNLNSKGVEKLATPSKGGNQETVFIDEPNLYRIIFRSNKKEATIFQNWVFEEVLPAIRKTGSYNTSAEAPTPMSVSNADWTRYLKVLTIPEMATLTGHDEKSVISGLYHATHSSDARTPKQPILPNPPPQVQTVLDQFWDTVSQLDLQQINHSRDPQVLAISLPELYHQAGEQLPKRRSMLTALKHSLIPKFKDSNHPINSTITGNTKKCWVFVMPDAQQ